MAIAHISEFEPGADRTTMNDDAVSRRLALDEDRADGLILHAAGFSGGTF